MNDKPLPDDLAEKIICQLERDSADIEPAIVARLAESRLKALEHDVRPSLVSSLRWLTVSGMLTAVIIVIAASLWIRTPKTATYDMHSEDVEVLASSDQIELYRDLDFYRWLEVGGDAH